MVITIHIAWLAAFLAIAVTTGSAITLLAYKIGQRSDRLSKLIDKAPSIISGCTNIIGAVRDMIEAEKLRRT